MPPRRLMGGKPRCETAIAIGAVLSQIQMRTAFRDPPADLAFINGGTLRIDDFVADDITFEDIGRTFGFSSYLRHMAMSGGEFRKTLEAGYRGTGEGKGYFPQISGFRVCVDRNRPDGQRIVQMQVPTAASAWQEIEPEHMYSVVVPDFPVSRWRRL